MGELGVQEREGKSRSMHDPQSLKLPLSFPPIPNSDSQNKAKSKTRFKSGRNRLCVLKAEQQGSLVETGTGMCGWPTSSSTPSAL